MPKEKQTGTKRRKSNESNEKPVKYMTALIAYVRSVSAMVASFATAFIRRKKKGCEIIEYNRNEPKTSTSAGSVSSSAQTTSSEFYNLEMLAEMKCENTRPDKSELYTRYRNKFVKDREDMHKAFFGLNSKDKSLEVKKKRKSTEEESNITSRMRFCFGESTRKVNQDINYKEVSSGSDFGEDSNGVAFDPEKPSTSSGKQGSITVYVCTFCTRSFSNKNQYEEHKRLHTGERLRCHCGATFVGRNELKLHEREHELEKKYSCDKCDKEFSDKNAFEKHTMEHRDLNKRLTCSKCLISFGRYTSLQKHLAVCQKDPNVHEGDSSD